MNFVDTMMSGRFSHIDLAGVAIGSSIWLPVFTGISGVLLALTPIVSQHLGAHRKEKIPHAVIQGTYIALVLAAMTVVIGAFLLKPLLQSMNLETDVRQIAHDYLIALSLGIIPLFLYTLLRAFIDALGKTRTTMIITLLSLPINVFFNYVLIFGVWGFPRLGGVGAGYASALTYWLIAIFAFVVVVRHRPFRDYRVFSHFSPISISAWKEQLWLGLPIGLSIFVEVSIFSAVAILMSQFGTVVIAAHQAAINFASLLYMTPLSISMALTIAVGYEVGAQRNRDALQYTLVGVSTSLIIALMLAGGLVFFRQHVASLYTTDSDVLMYAYSFLFYAIFFQLSDAVAAPIQGALRGYKDVNVTFILSLMSYWVIGLPLGYALTHMIGIGPHGYWIGLSSGLAAGAIMLSFRLRYRQKHSQSAESSAGSPSPSP